MLSLHKSSRGRLLLWAFLYTSVVYFFNEDEEKMFSKWFILHYAWPVDIMGMSDHVTQDGPIVYKCIMVCFIL